MPSNKPAFTFFLPTALFFLTMFLGASAAAQSADKVLHSFSNAGTDGYGPTSALTFDSLGNLYGTTASGGTRSGGTVFEMVSHGSLWKEKVLFNFPAGYAPESGVIMDASGVLYGVTNGGGQFGSGTVFSLVPQTDGHWNKLTLHSFQRNGTDGSSPVGSLIMDASGNLYGTTFDGGTDGVGTVFELSPQPGGVWTETILHSFASDGTDGTYPQGNLTFDSAGNLYGTTNTGGGNGNCSPGCGTVFQLTFSGGVWTETLLHVFGTQDDGFYPIGGLTFDTRGNLYGVTTQGATAGFFTAGAVFELSPAGGGVWNEKAIYQFQNSADGASPAYVTLVFDAAGTLYGTTSAGGASSAGTVFALKRTAGAWSERAVYSFSNDGADGQSPMSGVVLNSAGNLFGTTLKGGTPCGCGTVFEVKP
jgi:uncharacterized repeat protein (TIGR03803 family)